MRLCLALLAATLAILPAVAASRRGFCTPAYIEGAGKVLICASARTRRTQ
jgi:hypothetical protein